MSLFSKTVDSILSSINTSIVQLRKLAEDEKINANVAHEKAQALLDEALTAEQEAERAANVADKLQELIA